MTTRTRQAPSGLDLLNCFVNRPPGQVPAPPFVLAGYEVTKDIQGGAEITSDKLPDQTENVLVEAAAEATKVDHAPWVSIVPHRRSLIDAGLPWATGLPVLEFDIVSYFEVFQLLDQRSLRMQFALVIVIAVHKKPTPCDVVGC